MFCGRSESEVPVLLQGIDACICSECVKLAGDYVRDYDRSTSSSPALGRQESRRLKAIISRRTYMHISTSMS